MEKLGVDIMIWGCYIVSRIRQHTQNIVGDPRSLFVFLRTSVVEEPKRLMKQAIISI